MQRKNDLNGKSRKITFSLAADDARKVCLVGEFNGWNTADYPMKKDKSGKWKKQLALPPGDFEYKFVVDDQWVADPQNDRVLPNCFGTWNSVVQIKA